MAVSALAWAGLTFAPAALANSAHFIGTPTCTKSLGTGLGSSGKAAVWETGRGFVSRTAASWTRLCAREPRRQCGAGSADPRKKTPRPKAERARGMHTRVLLARALVSAWEGAPAAVQ